MGKLVSIWNLFRKGEAVANPEVWKDGGNAANLLVPLLVAIVKLLGDFGYGIQLSTETAVAIAGGLVAAVQFVVLNVSSKKAGILPAKDDAFDGQTP